MKRAEPYLYPLAATIAVLAIWHAAVVWSGTRVFPAPKDVLMGMNELLQKGLMLSYIGDSLRRVSAGYIMAVGTGIPLGLAIGWFPPLAAMINPVIQMLRPISPLAWTPLAVIWFGVSEAAPIFLIYLSALFTITVATAAGVRGVPGMYWQAGRNFGLSSAGVLFRILLPSTMPQMIVGLRVALGVAWIVVVAAEMIAVNSGLGYLIIDSRNAGKRYDLVVAGMLLIGTIGLCLDIAFRRLEKLRNIRWGFQNE